MTRINWNAPGQRFFEAGVDRGVLYPRLGAGVPWNGLISVSEKSTGGEMEPLHFDGVKYRDYVTSEDFQAEISAFSSPPEFAAAEGVKMLSPGLFVTQQPRSSFGFCYRTLKGNDLVGAEYGYKIHIVYNCMVEPSARNYQTLSSTISPETRSWTVHTVPNPAATFRPTAHVVIDSTLVDPYLMGDLETTLYGRDASGDQPATAAYLPTIPELVAILSNPISEFIEATI